MPHHIPETTHMHAVAISQFGDDAVLVHTELPRPVPGEGEVLVRIRAAGVNPVDWKIREGWLKDFIPVQFPAILGWDMAGEVVANGFAARRFTPGEAVYAYARRPAIAHGTYAEYIALPEAYLARKPANVSFEEAAGVPLAGLTAWQSLFDAAQLKAGESVLVLGASGGVGTFAVQLARIAGAKVVGVASARNHAYLQELGAAHAVDYRQEDWTEAVRAAVPGGVDVILDCVGGPSFHASAPALRPGGRVVSICESGAAELFASNHATFAYVFVEPNSRQLDEMRGLIESGQLRAPVSQSFPLEEAPAAHRAMQTGHTRAKIVLKVAGP